MLQYYCTVVQCSALASLIVAFVEGSEATDVYSVVDDTFLNAYVTISMNFGYGIRSFVWCGHFAYDSWFSNQSTQFGHCTTVTHLPSFVRLYDTSSIFLRSPPPLPLFYRP
jgi:hypothetical protein